MKSSLPDIPQTQGNEVRQEQVAKKQKEYHLIGSQRKVPGHTLFEFNRETNEIRPADIALYVMTVYLLSIIDIKLCIGYSFSFLITATIMSIPISLANISIKTIFLFWVSLVELFLNLSLLAKIYIL